MPPFRAAYFRLSGFDSPYLDIACTNYYFDFTEQQEQLLIQTYFGSLQPHYNIYKKIKPIAMLNKVTYNVMRHCENVHIDKNSNHSILDFILYDERFTKVKPHLVRYFNYCKLRTADSSTNNFNPKYTQNKQHKKQSKQSVRQQPSR